MLCHLHRANGGAVGLNLWATCRKVAGFDSRWGLRPWGWLNLQQKWVPRISAGGQRRPVPIFYKFQKSQPPGALRACPGPVTGIASIVTYIDHKYRVGLRYWHPYVPVKKCIELRHANIYLHYSTLLRWLRHCATSRKVAGSIPDGVTGFFFQWHNPSGRTMALGSTQPLTEMSTRNVSWG